MAAFEIVAHGWKAQDLTGKRYGNLSVLEFSHRKIVAKGTRLFWTCICDCGAETQVMSYHLAHGEVRSCGSCDFADNNRHASAIKLPCGEASLRSFYSSYMSNAKTKKRLFSIPYEVFVVMTRQVCHYCGSEPVPRHYKKTNNGPCIANGLDRVDSSKPYTEDNVVTCCSPCNTMKLDMSYNEFKAHIKRIYSHLKL